MLAFESRQENAAYETTRLVKLKAKTTSRKSASSERLFI